MTNNENQINYSFDKRRICIKDCRDILLMSVKNREIAVEAAARQWLQKNPGKEGYIELVRASAECDVMRKKYKVPTMDPVKRQCQIDNLSIWERIIITAQSRSSSNKKATKCRANRKKKKFHAIVVGASLTSSSTSTTSQSSSSVPTTGRVESYSLPTRANPHFSSSTLPWIYQNTFRAFVIFYLLLV